MYDKYCSASNYNMLTFKILFFLNIFVETILTQGIGIDGIISHL